jgi:hypothetical protein
MKARRSHSYLTPFRIIFVVLLIACASGAAKAATKAEHLYLLAGTPHQKKPFTLTLQAPKQPLKAGQPLILHVKVTNILDHAVHVPLSRGGLWGRPGQIYHVHALDEHGHPAPPYVPPPPPKGKKFIYGGSMPSFGVKPGQSLTDEVNISQVYDLSQPGKYKIWIAEPFYRGPNVPNGVVRSNTITATVVK